MRKALVVSIVILILLSALTVSFGQSDFNDVKQGNWAFESIDAMSRKDVITGYPDGTFRPGAEVTYAEFIKMMVASVSGAGNPEERAGKTADSVSASEEREHVDSMLKQSHWAAGYYEEAVKLGFFHQDDIPASLLDQSIPRGHMALIISAALGDTEIENYDAIEETVNDVNSRVRHDYHIIKTYAAGIMSGYPDKTFRPEGRLSRAEASIVLHRFTDPIKRTPVTGLETEAPEIGGEELVISQENSFNKELVWVKEGDIHEVLEQSAIDAMTALAPLEKYIIVEDASQFDLQMKSGPNYTWLEITDNRAYDEFVLPYLITAGKISEIDDGYYVMQDSKSAVFYKGDIKDVEYIALSPTGGNVVTLILNPF